MYNAALRVCTLIILVLFSNHVREMVVQGQSVALCVGYTVLLSLELALCYGYFQTKQAFFRRALGGLFVLHLLYPAYLLLSVVVVSPESLATPYGAGMLLFILIVFADAAGLVRRKRVATGTAVDGWAWYGMLFFLTYTPLVNLTALPSQDVAGLANDYAWFLYGLFVLLLLSLFLDKVLTVVAPAIALFSTVYLVTHFWGAPYLGRFVPMLLAAHGVYAILFAVVLFTKRRPKRRNLPNRGSIS